METTERDELVLVIQWLRRHPEELAAMIVAARLDLAPETIWPNVDDALAQIRRREAERYFHSGFFGWCGGCLKPYVIFADGVAIEWETRERHYCEAKPHYRAVAV